jgi:hypothetical protein
VRLVQSAVQSLTTGRQTSASLMSEFQVANDRLSLLRIYPESGAIERIALGPAERDAVGQ